MGGVWLDVEENGTAMAQRVKMPGLDCIAVLQLANIKQI